jgi:hypothetical protein
LETQLFSPCDAAFNQTKHFKVGSCPSSGSGYQKFKMSKSLGETYQGTHDYVPAVNQDTHRTLAPKIKAKSAEDLLNNTPLSEAFFSPSTAGIVTVERTDSLFKAFMVRIPTRAQHSAHAARFPTQFQPSSTAPRFALCAAVRRRAVCSHAR